jgi:hypothetical protein
MIQNKGLLFASLIMLLGAAFAQYGTYGSSAYGGSSQSTVWLEVFLNIAMPLIAVALLAWVLAPIVIIWKQGDKPEWAMVGVLASSSSLGVVFILFYLMVFGMLMSYGGMSGYGSSMSSVSRSVGAYGMIFMLEFALALISWMLIPLMLLQKVMKLEKA